MSSSAKIMIVEELERHVAIVGRTEAESLVKLDPGFWNVLSVRGLQDPGFALTRDAKSLATVSFDDVAGSAEQGAAGMAQIEHLLAFVDGLGEQAPLLVHCTFGQSRSPAVALGLLARQLDRNGEENPIRVAIDIVLRIRPVAAPNLHVVNLMFDAIFSKEIAREYLETVEEEERFRANRGKNRGAP